MAPPKVLPQHPVFRFRSLAIGAQAIFVDRNNPESRPPLTTEVSQACFALAGVWQAQLQGGYSSQDERVLAWSPHDDLPSGCRESTRVARVGSA